MKRRKILKSAASLGILAAAAPSMAAHHHSQNTPREWYEIRIYSIKFGRNANRLIEYLNGQFKEELLNRGARNVWLFNEYGLTDPRKIWCLITYPDLDTFHKVQLMGTDASMMQAHPDYYGIKPEEMPYTRFESWTFLSFSGLPSMIDPDSTDRFFELRTYEGFSEDAVRRKIKMFNVEEIELFHKTGLHPVFFGEMIAGPYRPCLTYMLAFKDMEDRDAAWQEFINHPEWNAMRVKEEYANSVSNIHKVFLTKL